MCAWMHRCIHLGMYEANHTWVFMSMYVLMYLCVHMYICMYPCMHVCVISLLPCNCTYIWCHWTNMTSSLQIWSTMPRAIMLNGHIDPSYLHISVNIQPTTISASCVNAYMDKQQICLSICHIYKLVHVHTWHNFHYKYLIWTHSNQQSDQKHCYTYISYYCHMPLNKYVCHIAYMSHCTTTVVHI